MSYISSQAKLHTASKKLGHKCKPVCRYYTNFAGTTVPPLTKKQYQKAMKRILKDEEHAILVKKANINYC